MSSHQSHPSTNVPPASPELTEYDRAHFKQYLMILDGVAAGASWQEIARTVLKMDPDSDPDGAKLCYEAHLKRARWMADTGYRNLLGKS